MSRSPTDSVSERAREVAAVHRGHVGRRQRRQRPRVVPVEQVAFERSSRSIVVERPVDPLHELGVVDESEVVRGERGEQAEADVGRRRAVRDGQSGPTWMLSGGRK